MKSYFAYIRVSTVKQGEHGSSLQEQRSAIESFAVRHSLPVVAWFEERETAAKAGRREFSRMLGALNKGKAGGVIFHKIDRSARNLKDWSAVQDLADQGIDVRFTQESVNLGSNEGKLTGDFLAVISSHYIRNLREEVRKGLRGRLKQGLYPWAAPTGYLDCGGGKPKTLDPVQAPLVRSAFELYATGRYSLHALAQELCRRGLRGKTGKPVSVNRLSGLLQNPFYIGVIRLRRSGESFLGVHETLVPVALFEEVRRILAGKTTRRITAHDFKFRRSITCVLCDHSLVGELQKGRVYYRCHTRGCPTRSIREDVASDAIGACMAPLELTEDERLDLRARAEVFIGDAEKRKDEGLRSIGLRSENLKGRMSRLLDAFLEGAVDRPLYEQKKLTLTIDQKSLEDERVRVLADEPASERRLRGYLELLESLPLTYEIADPHEKREILKTITSNLSLDRKYLVVELRSPFREIAKLASVSTGPPVRRKPRTFTKKVFSLLIAHCTMAGEKRQREERSLSLAA